MGNSLGCRSSQDGIVLREHQLAEVRQRQTTLLDLRLPKPNALLALAPVAHHEVACLHRMRLMLHKPAYVVENVAGFQSMRISADPGEGLPWLECLHPRQFCPLLLNQLLLLQDKFKQLKKLLRDRGLGVPETISSLVKCSMAQNYVDVAIQATQSCLTLRRAERHLFVGVSTS